MNQEDELWQVVNNGATQISVTPEQLWRSACDYFQWVDEHPIITRRTIQVGKDAGKKYEVEYKRPYSISGLCLHCGFSERYIIDINDTHDKESMWFRTMEKIVLIIGNQNLDGAMVDLYNPLIVSKVLKLDKLGDANDKPSRVEIVDSTSNKLARSETEVLEQLDFEKVELLKEKIAN